MAKRILILGAGVMQGPAIQFAKERGLVSVVVDGDASAPCVSMADIFEQIDLKDKVAIEAFARTLADDGGLSAVMTAGTDFSSTVAWVAERLELPGIPHEVALDASDKSRMRARLRSAGVPSPDFVVVSAPPSEQELFKLSFPVVVKPVDNMGSRGCRRANSMVGLLPAVEDALRYSRSGRVIVEEYMDGSEFSVDALVYNGQITICGLADRHIFFPPYFIEMGHTIPSALNESTAEKLLSVFKQAIRAIGITNGAAKGDVKLTPQGPMIGEIAARLSGGYMSGWTYPYASGVEPTRGAISIALGEAPEHLVPTRNWTCAERAFISIPGMVKSIDGLDESRAIPGVRDIFLRVGESSLVRFPENNVSKCGNVIASASTRALAVAIADRAARGVLIRLAAPHADTEAFLSNNASHDPEFFPPDAFPLTEELRVALANFPDPAPDARAVANGHVSILSFLAFESSGSRDHVGRSVAESLAAVRRVCGVPLPVVDAGVASSSQGTFLGARFWAALVRGGYQGAAYLLDSLRLNATSAEVFPQ